MMRFWLRAGRVSGSDGTAIVAESDSRDRSVAHDVEPGDIIMR